MDQKNLSHSLDQLQNLLEKEYGFKEKGKDLLYNTCQLIGDRLFLRFTQPENHGQLDIFDRVESLCFNSQIFYRKVALEENWWKSNAGPLLGFYGAENRPVALLPAGDKYYDLIDLEEKKIFRVNKVVDQALAIEAYMFYRALPDKKELKGRDIILFGLKGKGLLWSLSLGGISIFLSLFFPFGVSLLFSKIIPFGEKTLLWQLTIAFVLVAIGTNIFKFFRDMVILRFRASFTHDIQTGIWQRVYNLPLRFFRHYEVGDLIQRVSVRDNHPSESIHG